MEIEHRLVELRQIATRRVGGLAVPFGQEAQVGRLREVFVDAVGMEPALLNREHRPSEPLGVVTWQRSEKGLYYEAVLPEGARQDRALEDIEAGRLGGASIEFQCLEDEVVGDLRTVKRAVVVGVAATPRPVYSEATIEQRERLLVASEGHSGGRLRVWL